MKIIFWAQQQRRFISGKEKEETGFFSGKSSNVRHRGN